MSLNNRLKEPHPFSQAPQPQAPPQQDAPQPSNQEAVQDLSRPILMGLIDPVMQYTHNQMQFIIKQNLTRINI